MVWGQIHVVVFLRLRSEQTATAVAVAHGGGAVCNITSETIDCEREVKKHFGWSGRESFYCVLATSENEVKCGRRRRGLYEVVVDDDDNDDGSGGGGDGGGDGILGLNFIEN